ncbi:carbohydrate ABC transporter permease [Paenibacillus sedimenti]|uniref:Sugar ABC transporter permease n=1 Tax=Paenibacillus sedimenti TaxID=2770274 RepID=A0A926KMK9_9BACL|nr:sugar ABC transporter permease [Paenibacillus sedimenti]MBD0378800.1 sugar ABC transporter permease [Paenibacillus sedimenti]
MGQLGRKYDMTLGYILIIPVAFVIFVVIGFPFINAIYLSFTDKVVGVEPRFVGLDNYFHILTDREYWKVLKNTLIYMIFSVGIKLAVGLMLAVVVNESFFGRGLFRMILLIPWALSGMVAAITWRWMYDDTYGIINSLLLRLNITDTPIPWTSGIHIALVSVIIVNVWKGLPFFIFSLLGGLQTIDSQMYEAATIDGAGWVRQFFAITVPSIMPVITITTLLSCIWTFNNFESVYLITGGGPLNASAIISTYTYEVAFQQNLMGRALAVAGSVVPILVIMIVVSMRKMKADD